MNTFGMFVFDFSFFFNSQLEAEVDIPISKAGLLVKLEILGRFLCDRLPVSVKNV